MRLMIDGQFHDFIAIREFRALYHLPPEFGVNGFTPKDYTGLGRIDEAGSALNQVRTAVLAAIPESLSVREWLLFVPDLGRLFEQKLSSINAQVGLRDVEIDFAVAGFGDVCQAVAYALARAQAENKPAPDFRQIYSEWLASTMRVFSEVYPYLHAGETWQAQIVAHAYGRAGLIVRIHDQTVYIYDPALGCPAEGFMMALLAEIAEKMRLSVEH
jgi:hypothetical protein